MNKKYQTLVLGLAAGLIALACASASIAASWTSFESAQFSGINLSPALSSDTLNYTLTLSKTPTITIDNKTYKVNWIQAFYVVGTNENSSFDADHGGACNDWSWDAKDGSGQIAGWAGTGSERLMPGKSKSFQFSELNFKQDSVVAGYHVGFQDGRYAYTGFYRGYLGTVPEPASIISLGALLTGLIFKKRRALH